jgi:iron complex outermembrane recepter protein
VFRTSRLVFAALSFATVAEAEEADRVRFDVPAGPLGRSAIEVARAAGVSIGLTDLSLASRPARPLRGTMTAEQALRRLLQGTEARFIRIDARTFRIVRDPTRATRAPVRLAPVLPAAIQTAEIETDIIVTALKRPIYLSDFPGAISVVQATDLALENGARGTDAITSRLHTVTSTHYGSGRNKLFVRGIADSSFNGPTQATVGQYLGETRINYNAPDPDLRLYDLDRVEVLPGPQGTLYGAGSLGGIIRAVPRAPVLAEARGIASYGVSATEHGDAGYDAAGMVNLPIVEDRVGLRAVAYGIRQGGYIDDALRRRRDINTSHIWGGRAALAAEFGNGWRVTLSGTTQRARTDDAQYADRDTPPLTRRSPVAQPFVNNYDLADLTITREWDGYRLVSATGIVRQRLRERYDSSRRRSPLAVFDQLTDVRMVSSELRLSWMGDTANWLVGSSLVDNRAVQRRALGAPDDPPPIPGTRNAVTELTAFGEATIRPRDWLNLSAGARLAYTDLSDRALDPAPLFAPALLLAAQRDQVAFLPSASVSVRPSEAVLVYLRYQEGFRPGGLSATSISVERFESDHVRTMEGGMRYGLPGENAFDASLSLAYTRWSDIQADTVDFSGFPRTTNIGNGRIYSIDARIGWRPLPGLSLEAAGLFNDSLVTNPLPNIILTPRSPLPNVAKWNGRVSAEYRHDLSNAALLRVGVAGRYVGKSRLGIGPVLGQNQGNWFDLTLNARIEFDRHAFTFGVTNLLDQAGNRFALGSPFTIVERPQVTPLVPRTVRVGCEIRF